jgi:hypothetical protein
MLAVVTIRFAALALLTAAAQQEGLREDEGDPLRRPAGGLDRKF